MVIAILHALTLHESKIFSLKCRMENTIEEYGLPKVNIMVNPHRYIATDHEQSIAKSAAIGWGDPETPDWGVLAKLYGLTTVSHLVCLNLNRNLGVDGKFIGRLQGVTSAYWSKKVQQGQQKLFLQGYYIRSMIPYGMNKISIKIQDITRGCQRPRYVLKLGNSEEIEIVRLIFDLYVNAGYTITDISNLLSAQKIKSPGKSSAWTWSNVKKILENPCYIGANQFGNNVRYDEFEPALDKSIFFEAQAKLHRECLLRKIVLAEKY